jgi:probable rRNA maturation factor
MAVKKNSIRFYFIEASFYLSRRTQLKSHLSKLFKRENYQIKAVNYIFCTDAYLLKLNQDFLNHDTYTDIITFCLSKRKEPLEADIYISFERVKENAQLFHTSFTKELHRVIFHGALHLCGYKDKKPIEVKEMRFMEEFYLNSYFVSRETKIHNS